MNCVNCGGMIIDDSKFCNECGSQVVLMETSELETGSSIGKNEFKWDIRVPLLSDRIFIRQISWGFGLPFGILLLFLLFGIASGADGAVYALVFVGAFLIITFLITMLIFGRGQYISFQIDEQGILYRVQKKQSKIISILAFLLFILSLFAGRSISTGQAIRAGTRTEVFIPWNRIKKIKLYYENSLLHVKAGFSQQLAVYCHKEDFEDVVAYTRLKSNASIV
jgi:hypothetical protein